MPQVTISALAQRDLQRLQDFLTTKHRLEARTGGDVIVRAIQQLKTLPDIGRPVPFLPLEYKELVIGFGDSGYVMLYRHDREMDQIVIVTVRHQKESGYPGADSL
ncbi:type II toxin-antitoxin system RelE/ParE family toxin [Klebsiella pneumoniae]|uniref:type II toxin-antitoxin system RelE/ParE family toxin n=1 Tax=Klebsiella pneumoniae TaxID=573 RepID=UPI00280A8132|nr:type II toxin-antitoxin system RelE/ParE family toxin [Klebsiella pneumoniae]